MSPGYLTTVGNLLLQIFAGVEEISGVEGVLDLVVEMAEGRGGGKFPPRFFG